MKLASFVFVHSSTISVSTAVDSPQSTLKTMPCCCLNFSSQPLLAWKSAIPSLSAIILACSQMMGPDVGVLVALVCLNHVSTASSILTFVACKSYFLPIRLLVTCLDHFSIVYYRREAIVRNPILFSDLFL